MTEREQTEPTEVIPVRMNREEAEIIRGIAWLEGVSPETVVIWCLDKLLTEDDRRFVLVGLGKGPGQSYNKLLKLGRERGGEDPSETARYLIETGLDGRKV